MSRRRWAWPCGVFFLCAAGAQAAVTLGPTGAYVAAVAGVRGLESGEVADAIRLLQRAAAQEPEAWTLYHLGTAQLAAGDAALATAALERGLTLESSPELRWRALHNLGRARLDEALAASPGEALPSALEAVVASRDALRLVPGAAGTRRNLALADALVARYRQREPQPEPRRARDNGGVRLSGGSVPPVDSHGSRGMSPAEARAILDAIQSSEAQDLSDTMSKMLGGSRLILRPGRGPPW